MIIAPLAGLVWGGAAYAGYRVIVSAAALTQAVGPLWTADDADLPEVAARLYEEHFSADLKIRITTQDVAEFVRATLALHGDLIRIENGDPPISAAGQGEGFQLHLIGGFEKGDAEITVIFYLEGLDARIDNLLIEDRALAPPQ